MIATNNCAQGYRDPSRSVQQRVDDLLSRMTLREKVGQMLQLDARGDLEDIVLVRGAGAILHASPEAMLQAFEFARGTRLASRS
jgi:beta-glucosidase